MKLHRYQPICKYSIDNLLRKENWASKVQFFNDPFEFSVRSEKILSADGKIEYLSEQANNFRLALKDDISKMGVVSYADREYYTLLWSHYADNHRGMCLVFEVADDNDTINEVKYSKALPPADFQPTANIIDILRTKSDEWSYEREFRQIFREGQTHVEYPGDLVEIIFGCQANLNDMITINKIAESVYDGKILISKMFIVEDTFSLGKMSATSGLKNGFPSDWR